MRRFPLRTLLLMVVALLAFLRFWYLTHQEQPPAPATPASPRRGFLVEVTPEPADGGATPGDAGQPLAPPPPAP